MTTTTNPHAVGELEKNINTNRTTNWACALGIPKGDHPHAREASGGLGCRIACFKT